MNGLLPRSFPFPVGGGPVSAAGVPGPRELPCSSTCCTGTGSGAVASILGLGSGNKAELCGADKYHKCVNYLQQ